MVANGQLESPIGTIELGFEVADFEFRERFIIMKTMSHPLIGLCFLQRNNAIFDVRQRILTFTYLALQLTPENNQQLRVSTALLTDHSCTLYPHETLAITLKMPHLLDRDATGILTPSAHYDDHTIIYITS